jgi:16S rRNA (adenine1518-N6/adenine1519-N6)-dimethyltransferase
MSKRRALGQHFLKDAGIARRIVDLVAPTAADLAVEIGPGLGALTGELAGRVGRLIALEVDPDLVQRLRRAHPAIEVVETDARRWDYGALARPAGGRVLVVGNLPYSVGKPILLALIEARTAIDEMALMLQKEVAERLAAAPGGKTYGSLSVLTQLYADVRVAVRVPPEAFKPPPKVDSAVVHLRVLPGPRISLADEGRFHVIVRSAFAQRRKMLANGLAGTLGVPVERVRAAAEAAGIDSTRRAETLTIEEFASLSTHL